MSEPRNLLVAKATIIGAGAICVSVAIATLPSSAISWGFFAILILGSVLTPRMGITLPNSKFRVSFSDAVIFLSLLLYGGSAAIIVAAVEMFANCIYVRSTGFKFGRLIMPVNVSINAVSTAVTVGLLLVLQSYGADLNKTHHLISILGCLALSQFLSSSLLVAALQSGKYSTSLWETWKKDCFSSSMTQIVGAGVAGIFFKIVSYGDLIAAVVALITFGMVYLYFRQSVGEINTAFSKVEKAEKEKAETERERRREAEQYAGELAQSLKKEEQANAALRKSERDFQHAALHDSLTGLANRKNLNEMLGRMIARYKSDPTAAFQVLFLDIRSFKNINDTLGHTIGDKVLAIAAKRFQRLVSPLDTVARIGGDEFAIVLSNIATSGKAHKVARRIYDSIRQPFSLGGHKIVIDLNIGIAPCDAEYETPEEILRDADIAMHYAKERNDGLAIFTTELRSRFQERVRFEMDLSHAIERDELSMHYQPIISLGEGRLIGFEALVRWHHGEYGAIPPNKFIPIAEQCGLIQPMTVWILRETCSQLAEWRQIGPEHRDMIVSVNISGKHLSNNDLIDDVENALAETGLPPSSLKLEITESSAMENPEHTVNVLKKLKHLGVQLSIDDFGTGYSSLSYLQRLPFDTLKIDRSFVNNVGEHGENSEILQTIISLAKNLRLRVIAEGIETESQLAVLRNLGCDYGQGYLLAKPKGKDETEHLLYSRPHWFPITMSGEFEKYDIADEGKPLPVF